jgi:hypothetical protein
VWFLKGVRYWRVVPNLRLAEATQKAGGKTLAYQHFLLSTRRERVGSNHVYVPVLKRHCTHDQDFVESLRAVLSLV